MCSSRNRRIFRLLLGVNRKSAVTRWIGSTTVRVVTTSFGNRSVSRLKASEGAEKSFRCGRSRSRRKRQRGQRKGKRRSRGRHPRSNSLLTDHRVERPTERNINRHLRAFDYWEARIDSFGKWIDRKGKKGLVESTLVTNPRAASYGRHITEPGRMYSVWLLRWRALSCRVIQHGGKVIRDHLLGPTFSYFLEKRLRIVLNSSRLSISEIDARSVLVGMLQEIELSVSPRYEIDRNGLRLHLGSYGARSPVARTILRLEEASRAGPRGRYSRRRGRGSGLTR